MPFTHWRGVVAGINQGTLESDFLKKILYVTRCYSAGYDYFMCFQKDKIKLLLRFIV